MTISRPRAGRNYQFEHAPTPSPKTLKYGEIVDALKPGTALELARIPKAPRGVLRRFEAPFSRRPTTDTLEGKTAPQTPPYGLAGLFRGRPIHPRYGALETLHASARYPRGLVKRRSNTPNRRPLSIRNPPRNAKRPPPRRVPPSEGLKVGKVEKSKVVSRKSKVESRKVDRESRKPPEKSRKSLVFSKSEVVTNAEMPLRAAVSDSKGHFSSKS